MRITREYRKRPPDPSLEGGQNPKKFYDIDSYIETIEYDGKETQGTDR